MLELEKLQVQYAAQLQDALAASEAARRRLDALASASRESLQVSSDILQDEVIMADALDRPREQFYERISAQMAKTYELNDGVLDFLAVELGERLEQKRLLMTLLLSALAVVLCLVAYLYAGFYASTRASLQPGEIMGKVADGDLTVRFGSAAATSWASWASVQHDRGAGSRTVERVGQTVAEGGAPGRTGGERFRRKQPDGVRATRPDRAGGHCHERDVGHRPGGCHQRRSRGGQRPERQRRNRQRPCRWWSRRWAGFSAWPARSSSRSP